MENPAEQANKLRKATLYEMTMAVLGFCWMALLIVELANGLSPFSSMVFNFIWLMFVIDFVARFIRSAKKIRYLKRNWLDAVSLIVPAFRVFRVFRIMRLLRMASVLRGVQMARLITSFKRSLKALGITMHRRGFGYVVALTLIVVFSGAAGMYAFERHVPGQQGFNSYIECVWWTAMIITTLGSQSWPVTLEGRILCLLLSFYAVTMLGYIAATLASYFIDRDAAVSIRPADVKNLQDAVTRLNEHMQKQSDSLGGMQENTHTNENK